MHNSTLFQNIAIGLLIILSFIILQSNPVNAEIYKWTDDSGRVHYGDRPLDYDSEQILIKKTGPLSSAAVEREKKRQRLLEVMEDERQERKQELDAQRLAREKTQAKCDLAKQYLRKIQTASFIYKETDDSLNPEILSENERITAGINAKKAVDEWCSDG